MNKKRISLKVNKQNILNFWKKVNKDGTKEYPDCWIWTGPKTQMQNGYGQLYFYYYELNRKKIMERFGAHRASWIIHNGFLPKGINVCHHCDNPPCVRPDHLFLGTYKDNMQDAKRKNRTPKGEEILSSKLSTDLVILIKAKWTNISQRKLAKILKVGPTTISNIRNNIVWKWIEIPSIDETEYWKHLNELRKNYGI